MPTKREAIVLLQNIGLLTKRQIEEALAKQRENKRSIKNVLKELGYLTNENIGLSLLPQFGILPRSSTEENLPVEVVKTVPSSFAKEHRVIPFEKRNETIVLATDEPLNLLSIDYFKDELKNKVQLVIVNQDTIASSLKKYYGIETEDLAPLFERVDKGYAPTLKEGEEVAPEEEEEAAKRTPIIQLANLLIADGIKKRASDIHVEPLEHKFRIRYRIDGVLHETLSPPKNIQRAVIARLKLMAKMNLAEKRLPQDGRIMLNVLGRPIDLRVSTLPGLYGESLVMRILDKTTMLLGMDQLGFLPEDRKKWDALLKFSGGIALVTGPTGSGKTTTLYTSLNTLNTTDKKLMTVEEPVEYQIPGINQSQVRPEINLTFAFLLRSFLRQSPDVILVGEIRDFETADIALRAALTGHLVFSTLHTNDAPSAITRLIDLGTPPFLVASSLQGVMAQRLVRTLCPYCKEEDKPDAQTREFLKVKENKEIHIFKSNGCEACDYTGYHGRTGIFEIFIMNEELRQLALKKAAASTIKETAIRAGMRTIQEDGIEKIKKGLTTVDEVIAVTGKVE
ncbi:MAG: type II/IV secretion system protein [Candidatus Omnitrophica bacterium]|nr:type II/IV secretion system protein [Candidatus Omnitrophota bacterium]